MILSIGLSFYNFQQIACGIEKFKGVDCSSSNKSIYGNYTCFIKPVSRHKATLNVRAHLRRPIYKVYASSFPISFNQLNIIFNHLQGNYEVYYKKITTYYRKVINVKKVEVCSIMNGTSPNVNWVLELVRSTIPKGIEHSCLYEVKFQEKMRNLISNIQCNLFQG